MNELNSENISQTYEIKNERMNCSGTSLDDDLTTLPHCENNYGINLGNKFKNPIWKFQTSSKIIEATINPVAVEITNCDDLFFAENTNLMITATGATIKEAIDNFSEELIYLHEFYKNKTNNQLVGKALELKDKFNKLFRVIYYEAGQKKP